MFFRMVYKFFIVILVLFSAPGYSEVKTSLVLYSASNCAIDEIHYYIAGLYLDKPSNMSALYSASTSKAMQLIVAKEIWKKHNWARQWRYTIATNNPPVKDKTDTLEALMTFTLLLGDNLEKGDEIIIEYIAGKDTVVYINGETAMRSNGAEVMHMLLRTWLGSVPPSTEFRETMMNAKTGALWSSLENVLIGYKPPLHRREVFSSWQPPVTEVAPMEIAQLPATKIPVDVVENKPQILVAPKKKIIRSELVSTPKPNALVDKQAQKASLAAQKAQLNIEHAIQEQQYYLQLLQWDMQRYVSKYVEYPHWAKQFSEQGMVEITYRLTRKREILFDPSDSTVSEMLLKEVQRVLRKAAEEVVFPSGLNGEPSQLKAMYLFSLDNESVLEFEAPIRPVHLQNKILSDADREKIFVEYSHYFTRFLNDKITYPEWAKISRRKGIVTVQVTLNSNGDVMDTQLLTNTNSKDLDNVVIKAINDNAPYRAIPMELATDTLMVEYVYVFK